MQMVHVLPGIEKRRYCTLQSQNNCTKISGFIGNSATRCEVWLGGVKPSWARVVLTVRIPPTWLTILFAGRAIQSAVQKLTGHVVLFYSSAAYIGRQTKNCCRNFVQNTPRHIAAQRKKPPGAETNRADAITILRPVSF